MEGHGEGEWGMAAGYPSTYSKFRGTAELVTEMGMYSSTVPTLCSVSSPYIHSQVHGSLIPRLSCILS